MNQFKSTAFVVVIILANLLLAPATGAQTLQPLTVEDPSLATPSGGAGDSRAPIISPDGRYVLFASMANNLVSLGTNAPVPAFFPAALNVFLRDRTNGTTTLVSAAWPGTGGGNGDSVPLDISTNGRYALFESVASNLIAGDTNNARDVFLRDLLHGTNLLVSASTNGNPGNGPSRSAAMTPDGRHVVFVSAASNLVTDDLNGIPDIFARDMLTAVTTLVSVGAKTTNSPFGGGSDLPDITPDGRYVVFYSAATNLVAGVKTGGEIYVRDLLGGVTVRASTNAAAATLATFGTTNYFCYNPIISTNGQYVAFSAVPNVGGGFGLVNALILRFNSASGQSDIVSTNAAGINPDYAESRSLDMTPDGRYLAFLTNSSTSGLNSGAWVWDAQTRAVRLVSGQPPNAFGYSVSLAPTLDATGRFVLFLSNGTNLTSNPVDGLFHCYATSLADGTIQLVDVDQNGAGSTGLDAAAFPRVSADGRFVAFEAPDGALVPGDNNHDIDVFVRDLTAGLTELISGPAPALTTQTANRPSYLSSGAISENGQYLVFSSDADNLVPSDNNGRRDVFVRDLVQGTTTLVSLSDNGQTSANNLSSEPVISADGRFVAFTSFATDLVPGATSDLGDIYLSDLVAGTTTLVSLNTAGTGPGNALSRAPGISGSGQFVWFRSKAGNLVAGSSGSAENLYVRDMFLGTTYALTTNAAVSAVAATPDGAAIAFGSGTSLFLWNSATLRRTTYTNNAGALTGLALSPDGTKLAYSTGLQIRAADMATHSNWVISSWIGASAATNRQGLRFSADGRFLAYATTGAQNPADANGLSDVYLYDFSTRSNLWVSRSYSAAAGANGPSDSPEISPDGRWVAYRTQASNILAGDNNGVGDLFLYDRTTGGTTILSQSLAGNTTANHWSINAFFSGDSQTLVFQSWASDLVPQDFNHSGDIFALNLAVLGGQPDFSAQITGASPVTLVWPVVAGRNYKVQFKDDLSSTWQDLGGTVSVVGSQGALSDSTATGPQRFYRIVSY